MNRVFAKITSIALASTVLAVAIASSGCAKVNTIGGIYNKGAYKRVVSLSPSSTEVAGMLPFVEVVGKTASCDWPMTIKGVVVMKGVKPDYESIIKMGPDAIFYDSDIIPKADLKPFEDAKIPLVATDGGAGLNEFKDSLRKIGALTHGEPVVSKYIDQIDRETNQARVVAMTPTPKVAILLPSGGSGEHMIAGLDSFPAVIVNASGGQAVGPAGRLFVPLNAEDFIRMNPDMIVVAGEKDSVVTDPRFKSMTAFTKKRIAVFAPSVLIRKGQRVDSAIKNMASTIVSVMTGAGQLSAPSTQMTPTQEPGTKID